MDARLRAQVRDRAGGRCEYCRIHEDEDPFFTFPIDHVIAQQHGGATTLDNLCLSCSDETPIRARILQASIRRPR